MHFHCQQADKKSSPTKVTRNRGAQYGKHFPSTSSLPFCGSQKCTEQSALLPKPPSASPNTTSACEHLCAEGRQCPQTAQQSSSLAEGSLLHWRQPNKPLDHSKYPLVEKLKNNFKTTPGVISNKLQKEMLL